jgi:hypothetical protein
MYYFHGSKQVLLHEWARQEEIYPAKRAVDAHVSIPHVLSVS